MAGTIITVGRQYGSGGRYVARLLAEKLGIPFYDKELLAEVAKDSGICKELLEEHDEKNSRSFLFSMMSGTQPMGDSSAMYMDMPLNHKIFLAQFDTIKKLAQEESCIIVGRCANYILKDNPNVLSVFVHADEDFCLARAMERNSFSEKETKKFIERTDKYRSDYYRYHTGHHWTDARYYDLCLDSSKLGFENCALEIEEYVKIRFGK